MNSNQYGSLDYLSQPVKEQVLKIIEKMDKLNLNYDIYYGYPVISEDNRKDYVKGIIITKYKIIILYENDKEINSYGSALIRHLSLDKELFHITANYPTYIEEIDIFCYEESLDQITKTDEVKFNKPTIKKINRAIQNAFNLSSVDDRPIQDSNTLGARLKERNTYIGNYDSTQFNMVHSPIKSHQRIRGLAGSGKTILMLKKLAYLHYKYPNLNLAFVFYTTSLKQDSIKKFKEFYKDYDRYNDPDMNKINIFHAWGGSQRVGLYSYLCERIGVKSLSYSSAKAESGKIDPFEYVCLKLTEKLKEISYKGHYDFIFIDEAQDFDINFFKLCLQALRKPNLLESNVQSGYLIYAYDELQSLRKTTQIPSKKEIFGEESLCEDINLKRCYRTPVEILTSAHAIGLGVYRSVEDESEHPLVNLVDEKTLVDIGYNNLTGEFKDGEEVILERNEEKSGIEVNIPGSFENEELQYESLADHIIDLIKNEDILPRDIMIIDLDELYISKDHTNFSNIFLKKIYQEDNIDRNIKINLVDRDNPVRVTIENAITFTTIYRAKGNEANLVFVINCNSLSLSSRNSNSRNKIFTAMTRAKWKVWLYGNDMEEYASELDKIKSNGYKLIFNYPTEEQREYIKVIGDKEQKVESRIDDASEILDSLPDEVVEKLLERRRQKRIDV